MKIWRIILLAVLGAVLLTVSILTWGSMGSALCIFLLITMGASLLVKHFLIDRKNDDFDLYM